MEQRYEKAAHMLSDSGSIELDTFSRIGAEVDSLPLPSQDDPAWRKWRRAKLDLWLRAIDMIDRTKDATFDPEDVPLLNVAPPASAGLRAGVDPASISDPKLRQEYKQAIKRNADKAQHYRLQNGIRKLDNQWMESLRVYLQSQYTLDPQDLDETDTLINQRISVDSRKQQIRAFIISKKRT